jgi:hypothetical protein
MDVQPQQKTLDMQRGLFLIKYESSEDRHSPPTVHISPDNGSESSIELILPPEADRAVLWSPGASLVVRATDNGRLRLVVTPAHANGSASARVQVVSLSNDPAGVRLAEAAGPLDLTNFRVLGHVAGRGDVIVDAEHWIAGPLSPSRIEGFAIQWPDQVPGLALRYSVAVGGPRPSRGSLVDAGTFVGTRGRALPLIGAMLEISGPAANGQQLVVDSIFLGSPQTRAVGQKVVLSGPTGREPLVGLRVRIDPVDQPIAVSSAAPSRRPRQPEEVTQHQPQPQSQPAVVSDAAQDGKDGVPPAAAKRSGRVRVFRSQNRKPVAASPATN